MPLRYLISRLVYYRLHMLALYVALCIMTGFATLYVTYSDSLKQDYIRTRIANANATDFEIVLRDSTRPIDPNLQSSLAQNLGALFQSYQSTDRTLGVTCGINYPDPFRCYQIATMENLESLVTLVNGEMPQTSSVESRDDLETSPLQAVVMQRPAERANVALNEQVYFGTDPSSTLPVEITGVVVPTNPDDLFWALQTNVVDGIVTPVGIDYRNDVVLLVTQQDFENFVVPQNTDNLLYTWRIATNPTAIELVKLTSLQAGLLRFEQDFFQSHPQGQIDDSLLALVTNINMNIANAMVNVTTICLIILFLMGIETLYLAQLIVQRQYSEWEMLDKRGAKLRQKLWIQMAMGSVLLVLALLITPIMARGLITLFTCLNILLPAHAPITIFSPTALLWSALAGVSGLLLVVGAIWVNDSLRQSDDSQYTESILTIYFVDIGVFVLGILLILRTYFINSDNLSESIETLIRDPAVLSTMIRNQQDAPDPLNLLGPILIGCGLAIFSLRLFPPIIRGLTSIGTYLTQSPIFSPSQCPKLFAVPALIFMAVVAMTISASALQVANHRALAQTAFLETGGDVRIDFTQTEINILETFAPINDPNTHITPLLNLSERNPTQISLIGLDPLTFSANYPDYTDVFSAMDSANTPNFDGLTLPESSNQLSLQVNDQAEYSDSHDLQIEITIEDQLGINERLRFIPIDEPARNTFVEYSLELPSAIQPPWRITDFHFRTVLPSTATFDDFVQAVFLDDLNAITIDGDTITIDDFERARLAEWELPNRLPRGLVAVRLTTSPYSGEASLRVGYSVLEAENINPQFNTIPLNVVRQTPIPIVVSESIAKAWGNQDNNGDPLTIGFEGDHTLPDGLGRIALNYRIIAILETFPTLTNGEQFIIAPANRLWLLLNRNSQPDDYFHWNQAWITTNNPAMVGNFADTITAPHETHFSSDTFIALRDDPLANLFPTLLHAGAVLSGSLLILVFVFHYLTHPLWSVSTPDIRPFSRVTETVLPYLLAFVLAIGISLAVTPLLTPFLTFFRGEQIQPPLNDTLRLAGLTIFILGVCLTGLFLLVSSHSSQNELEQKNEDIL